MSVKDNKFLLYTIKKYNLLQYRIIWYYKGNINDLTDSVIVHDLDIYHISKPDGVTAIRHHYFWRI